MNTLKNRSIIGLTLVVIAMVALVALPAGAQDNPSNADGYPMNTITVIGNGSAAGAPDIATVEIGVETRNEDVSLAFSENSTTVDAVIAALVEAGVAREDIRTSGLNIYLERYPMGMPEGPEDYASTYIVNNMVRVVVRDTGAVGDVLSAAVEAGANNIYGLTFGIEDQAALESEARVEAMANAETRAAELAQIAGVELGEVVVISESWGSSGPFDVMNLAQAGYGGGAGAPIEPGQLSVVVQIQVTYRIDR